VRESTNQESLEVTGSYNDALDCRRLRGRPGPVSSKRSLIHTKTWELAGTGETFRSTEKLGLPHPCLAFCARQDGNRMGVLIHPPFAKTGRDGGAAQTGRIDQKRWASSGLDLHHLGRVLRGCAEVEVESGSWNRSRQSREL
jgi:hypothetical protein